MRLRAKLFSVFGALALIALLVTAVAFYATLTWQATTAQIERHYQRSLLLESIRAGTFQALKEVDDALTGDPVDAREDFERALLPASQDFSKWSSLADTQAESEEVERVRTAHQRLITSAREVFDLIAVDRDAAIRLIDDEIDTRTFEQFRVLTEAGVEADRGHRRTIAAETERVRTTTQVMLAICAFSIISLLLLLAAFLAHDLFRPLRGLVATLERLNMGDLKARSPESGEDEIGAAAGGLNRFADAMERRMQLGAAGPRVDAAAGVGPPIGRAVGDIQARLASLLERSEGPARALLAQAGDLSRALGELVAIGYPLDLELEDFELPALIHDVVARHRSELTQRSVGLEITLAPAARHCTADRLKLREALSVAVRHALDRLPESGGRLGFRTLVDPQRPGFVRIELADDGPVLEREQPGSGLAPDGTALPAAGLVMARALVERHGGTLTLLVEEGSPSVLQISLPA